MNVGEKKDFYIVNFFFTRNHVFGEKKGFYMQIFFFTINHVFGEKKDLYMEIFFFTRFYVLKYDKKICEKKVFYIIIFFFTKFYVSKNFSELHAENLVKKKINYRKSFFSPSFMFSRFSQIF